MDFLLLATKVAEVVTAHPDWTNKQIADSLNAKTASQNCAAMTGDAIFGCVVAAEFLALTPPQQTMVVNLLHSGQIDPFGTRAQIILGFFGESQTATNIGAARVESISWADLNWSGTLKVGHVQQARGQ